MLSAKQGDITTVTNVDYICNAANGQGTMGGGVAAAIKKAGGEAIEQEAAAYCKKNEPKRGELYTTTAASLPYEAILHLVTMKGPEEKSNYDVVYSCLQSLIRYCQENHIYRVALPALGTATGGLDPDTVAIYYLELLHNVREIQFIAVDMDETFIQALEAK